MEKLVIEVKRILKQADIDTEVFFAELNWQLLLKESSKNKVTFTDISKYPSVKRDLALLIDKHITFEEIKNVIFSVEKKLIQEVSLFDVYEGKNLPADKKSYAVSMILQDETKTLNDKQIDFIMQKIQEKLQQVLDAKLR